MKPFHNTSEISTSSDLMQQVIGQEEAINIVKIAAKQRRFVLLIGDPGTGKSMLGKAFAEHLNPIEQESTLLFFNKSDATRPLAKKLSSEQSHTEIKKYSDLAKDLNRVHHLIYISVLTLIVAASGIFAWKYSQPTILFWGLFLLIAVVFLRKRVFPDQENFKPKLLFPPSKEPPFIDATGCHEGGLLGDVRHDPYQSGGNETAPHLLVEAGAIHRAHRGVLYIDEVSTLSTEAQLSLLTAIQNQELPITGRSSGSSGTMVQTAPVVCDFSLVIAGHKDDLDQIHPALRSRMKGYGYEVYLKTEMADSEENRNYLVQFIAQEVEKDQKIPHFTYDAVQEIIQAARELSAHKNSLTCRFRDLGGLIRAAGDQAVVNEHSFATKEDVLIAKRLHASIEQKIEAEKKAQLAS